MKLRWKDLELGDVVERDGETRGSYLRALQADFVPNTMMLGCQGVQPVGSELLLNSPGEMIDHVDKTERIARTGRRVLIIYFLLRLGLPLLVMKQVEVTRKQRVSVKMLPQVL